MEQSKQPKTTLDRISLVISTLGIGYLPFAPGTWASLAVVISYYYFLNTNHLWLILIISLILGCLFSVRAAQALGSNDPGQIIIDEVSGMSLALLFCPKIGWLMIIAFIAFRFFDIKKIYPSNILEKIPGAIGIISDDLLAGLYTAAVVQLILFLAQI